MWMWLKNVNLMSKDYLLLVEGGKLLSTGAIFTYWVGFRGNFS